jgi:hypothetical protein
LLPLHVGQVGLLLGILLVEGVATVALRHGCSVFVQLLLERGLGLRGSYRATVLVLLLLLLLVEPQPRKLGTVETSVSKEYCELGVCRFGGVAGRREPKDGPQILLAASLARLEGFWCYTKFTYAKGSNVHCHRPPIPSVTPAHTNLDNSCKRWTRECSALATWMSAPFKNIACQPFTGLQPHPAVLLAPGWHTMSPQHCRFY